MEHMTRIAAIDIGTNSVRLATGTMQNGMFCCGKKEICTTRIGEGTSTRDELGEEPMRRTAQAVADFASQAKKQGYALLGAYATSAVREAPNRADFIDLCRQMGVQVDVLSGQKESAVAFYGAALGKSGLCAVADIGGGSTELSFGRDAQLIFGASARVGAVRMREMFAHADGGLDDASYDALLSHVCEALLPIAKKIPKDVPWLGVGGTFTTLCAMQLEMREYDPKLVQDTPLADTTIERFSRTLCRMTQQQRLGLAGLPARRADIIACAAVIAHAVMRVTGAQEIFVSERDGLEGYAQAKALGVLETLGGADA